MTLRLTDDEQAHLLRLAGHAADPRRVPRLIPAGLLRITEELADWDRAHPDTPSAPFASALVGVIRVVMSGPR